MKGIALSQSGASPKLTAYQKNMEVIVKKYFLILVIIGLVCALDLSKRVGLLDEKLFNEYLKLPLMLKDKIVLRKFDTARIYEIMKRDKKGRDHKIKFVLVQDIGNVVVDVEVSESDVTQSIQQGMNYFVQQ